MKLKDLFPPCSRCLYKRGIIKTLVNPCPQCRAEGYNMFYQMGQETIRGSCGRQKESLKDE